MHQQVLDFWFNEIDHSKWFMKDEAFDELIKTRFLSLHTQASQCELYEWRSTAKGRLAEIIILDQFSRNIFRDQAQAFASDALALVLAQEAVANGADETLSPSEKSFLYMPYMHSESSSIHEVAVQLFSAAQLKQNVEFELKHKAIIDRFNRYPHRNVILGRESTQAEIEFLSQPNSSF